MHYRKRRTVPKLPKTTDELLTALEGKSPTSEYYKGSVNVLNSDEIAGTIFSNPDLVEAFERAEGGSNFGTFHICPKLFKQVFTIMFDYKHHFSLHLLFQ